MTPVVLDASVAAKWFLRDESANFSEAVLDRVLSGGAYVPALFRWEIESVLLGAERADRIAPEDVDAALETLRDLPIRVESPGEIFLAGSELRLAREHDLTPYDAAYLALASSRGFTLATADAELARAARSLGIDVHDS